MKRKKALRRRFVANDGKLVDEGGRRYFITFIFGALSAVGVLFGIYFNWSSRDSSKEDRRVASSERVSDASLIAINRYAEFLDVTRHLMGRRVQMAGALAKPDLLHALADPQMHFVMSDDWKASFATTQDEIRTIGRSSPVKSREIAECMTESVQANELIASGRDVLNAAQDSNDPQGIGIRLMLGSVKMALESTQKACMVASDDMYSLAYPNRQPIGHELEHRMELLIKELEKKEIDLNRTGSV